MDEKVLEALSRAAMLCRDETCRLAVDMDKINDILNAAAESVLSEGTMADSAEIAGFQNSAAMTAGEGKISLRKDEAAKNDGSRENLVQQSKYYDEPYSVVPRVV